MATSPCATGVKRIGPKDIRSLLCLESECKFDDGCGCLTELMTYRDEIIERCAQELETGLNVLRAMKSSTA